MGKWNSSNAKSEWEIGFSVPWAFKLDHLHPFKLLLFRKFSIFFIFILGSHFLLPQRANYGKGEFTQLQNWMLQMDFNAWGIQTGPFAFHSAQFGMKIFHLSSSYWEANSYYPRGLIMEKWNSPNSQYGWDWGVSVPWAFKLDHVQPFKPILFWTFSNFLTFILGANSYYPRGLIMGKGKFFQLPI